MRVYVRYPCTEKAKKLFSNNLAKFKSELILKGIDNLKISDKNKEKVLEIVLETLNDMPNGSVI